MSETFLIAGLGNPGNEYKNTRHNAGFLAVDFFAEKEGLSFDSSWQGGKAAYFKTQINGNTVYFLKPLTYMNLSGEAVSSFANFFKIPHSNILVIFDDMSIPLGSLRMRKNGSAGGQNGMSNILRLMGTQEIPRLRIGIGPKPDYFEGKDFVLSKFQKQEEDVLKKVFETTGKAIIDFVSVGIEKAMNACNTNKQ